LVFVVFGHLLDVHFWDKTDKSLAFFFVDARFPFKMPTAKNGQRQLNVNGFNWCI